MRKPGSKNHELELILDKQFLTHQTQDTQKLHNKSCKKIYQYLHSGLY